MGVLVGARFQAGQSVQDAPETLEASGASRAEKRRDQAAAKTSLSVFAF
jgi:hypothetical protein